MKFLYHLMLFFLTLFLVSPAFSEVITQFVPSASITVEYTDNFHQTQDNKDDEFSTIYGVGLSFGVIDRNASLFLNYNPEYTKHNEYSQYDAWTHDISLIGQYQASQHTSLTFSEVFVRDLNRTTRSNSWEQHDTNDTSVGILYQFGERDSVGMDYTYSFDRYDTPNLDEYKSHTPSASLSYWFTPLFGFDTNISYEKIEYEISNNGPEIWTGDIRLIRSMTRHFDIYISYAHTDAKRELGDYTIYYPSIGFDWRPTEDSGISMGFGGLHREYEYFENEDDFFIEFNGYQNFDLSRKASLSITGSSGYEPVDETAASLGLHIYGEVGFLFSYRLTRRLTAELDSSYLFDKYDQPFYDQLLVDRVDKTLEFGAGLVWAPLQWLTLNLSYEFTDFNTDANRRGDYQENVGLFTITVTPSTPVRYQSSTPRATLENRLFGR